jgi:hypothetical protein
LGVKCWFMIAHAHGAAPRRLAPGLAIAVVSVGLGTLAGCGGGRLESASLSFSGGDRSPPGASSYDVALSVFGDSACHGATPDPSFTMTLNDAALAYENCLASASGFLDDATFTLRLRDGDDSAEVVVTDLFPGLHATISNPAEGQIAPGSIFDVTVPRALQFETPVQFGAAFNYLDGDDPEFLGDVTNPTAGDGVIHVLAPMHPGHFTLWIAMSVPPPASYPDLQPKGTVLSCSGVSSCSAFGAPDIGPLAVDVGTTVPPAN